MHICADRLWSTLMVLAEIGRFCEGGVNRQALSDEEAVAWRQIMAWAQESGLEISVDPAANLFITLPGRVREHAPLLVGSHIDTQPTGGRFDGILGVLAGLEGLRSMVEQGIRPERDIMVVGWMNEEGSRFAPGMSGSEAFAGVRALDAIRAGHESGSTRTLGDVLTAFLARFADLPRRALGFTPAAYLELHIEQGPELEAAGVDIGIVTGIQGKKTYRIEIEGTAGHAGTVPMAVRADSLRTFAALADTLFDRMQALGPDIRFTIGQVLVEPNAPSVIPSRVRFSIDLRHPDNAVLDRAGHEIGQAVRALHTPCTITVHPLVDAASNIFDPGFRQMIGQIAARHGLSAMPILSTAGHDARNIAMLCPSGMIFVPSHRGISHAPQEWTTPRQVRAGAQVLADMMVELGSAEQKTHTPH
ncbi:M20 family metallo-hydrolase [Komagataeibacter rhaeticus]|uniref:M20 family metallo-hydrolase n=1 Tax=Komagataeibacter rhaeticus TaxID=215221 RepID=UPI0039ED6C9C